MDLRNRNPWQRNIAESIIRFRLILLVGILIQAVLTFASANVALEIWSVRVLSQSRLYWLAFQNSVFPAVQMSQLLQILIPFLVWVIMRTLSRNPFGKKTSIAYLWGFLYAIPILISFLNWQIHFELWWQTSLCVIFLIVGVIFLLKKDFLMPLLPISICVALLSGNAVSVFSEFPLVQLDFQTLPISLLLILISLEAHWFARLLIEDFKDRQHKTGSCIAILSLQIKPILIATSITLLVISLLFIIDRSAESLLISIFWAIAILQTLFVAGVLIPAALSLFPFKIQRSQQ
jgi:hypothetical protein